MAGRERRREPRERAGHARQGAIPPHVVMVYGPRDDDELDVVLRIVRAAYEWARAGRADAP